MFVYSAQSCVRCDVRTWDGRKETQQSRHNGCRPWSVEGDA